MAAKSKSRTLTDHEEIKQWAEERDAKPVAVRSTGGSDDVGIIRLDFPGYSGGDSLETIDWNDWFEKFDESNLALLVQDATAGGERSNFNKLVSRSDNSSRSADQRERSVSRSKRASSSSAKRAGSSGRAQKRTSRAGRSSQTSGGRTSQSTSSRGKREPTSVRSNNGRSNARSRGSAKKSSSRATTSGRKTTSGQKKSDSRRTSSRSTRRAA